METLRHMHTLNLSTGKTNRWMSVNSRLAWTAQSYRPAKGNLVKPYLKKKLMANIVHCMSLYILSYTEKEPEKSSTQLDIISFFVKHH